MTTQRHRRVKSIYIKFYGLLDLSCKKYIEAAVMQWASKVGFFHGTASTNDFFSVLPSSSTIEIRGELVHSFSGSAF